MLGVQSGERGGGEGRGAEEEEEEGEGGEEGERIRASSTRSSPLKRGPYSGSKRWWQLFS